MTYLEIALVALCVYLVLAPPKYDPAIRLKEWMGRPKAEVEIDDTYEERVTNTGFGLVEASINQTCSKCGGEMEAGYATEQTFTAGSPDFPGSDIVTMSAGGPGRMIPCRKCKTCGWSVTA